jgi:glycosyltransferase involved in cell wall biosynthesis
MTGFRAQEYILSVVIPVYNGVNRISFLLESLARNNYTDHPSIEIIVSDNCSIDGTADLLASWQDCLKIILNEINVGFQGNLIKLLQEARGKYIWIVGDDDVIHLHSSFILQLVEEYLSPTLFVSEEEYALLSSNPFSRDLIFVMPFGFISSTIQPNTSFLLDAVIAFSSENNHASPHFFARWLFFLLNGPGRLAKLPSVRELAFRVASSNSSTPPRSKLLRDRLYCLLKPWTMNPVCRNWYNAFLAARKQAQGELICEYIMRAECGFFFSELKRDPPWIAISWLEHVFLLLFYDPKYSLYLITRLMRSARIMITNPSPRC